MNKLFKNKAITYKNLKKNKKFLPDNYVKAGCYMSIIIGILLLVIWISITSTSIFQDLGLIFSDKIWNAISLVLLIALNAINIIFNIQILLGIKEHRHFAILSSVIIGGVFPALFIYFGEYIEIISEAKQIKE